MSDEVFDGNRGRAQRPVDGVNHNVVVADRSQRVQGASLDREVVLDALDAEPFPAGQALHGRPVVNALGCQQAPGHVVLHERPGRARIGSDAAQFGGVQTCGKKKKIEKNATSTIYTSTNGVVSSGDEYTVMYPFAYYILIRVPFLIQ